MSGGSGLAINASPVGVSTNGELRLKNGHRDGFCGLEHFCRICFRLLIKIPGFHVLFFSFLSAKVINDTTCPYRYSSEIKDKCSV
jgi:hypothetical protein